MIADRPITAQRRRPWDLSDVAIGGAVLLLFAIVFYLPFKPNKFGDRFFHEDAMALASAVRGSGQWSDVRIRLAPGPVLFYAVPYLFVPPGSPEDAYWRAAVAFTIPGAVLAVLLIRRAAANLGGKSAGIAAAGFALAAPFAVYYGYGITAEPLAYCGMASLVYGWSRVAGGARAGILAAASGLSALVLARPNAALLFLFLAAAVTALWRSSDPARRAMARNAALAGTVAVAVIAGVFALVAVLQRSRPHLSQSANFYYVAFHGSFQFRTEPLDWRYWDDAARVGSVDYRNCAATNARLIAESHASGQTLPALQKRWILDDIASHPLVRLRMAFVRLFAMHIWVANSQSPAKFHMGPLRGPAPYFAFHALVNSVFFFVVGATLWLLWRCRREFAANWALWAPWAALTLFHALVYSEPRYLFPVQPALCVGAALAVTKGRRQDC
jgi:hypothetical protein